MKLSYGSYASKHQMHNLNIQTAHNYGKSVRKASEQFCETEKALILPPGHPISWCDYSLIDSLSVFVHCVHVCVCVSVCSLCHCVCVSTYPLVHCVRVFVQAPWPPCRMQCSHGVLLLQQRGHSGCLRKEQVWNQKVGDCWL